MVQGQVRLRVEDIPVFVGRMEELRNQICRERRQVPVGMPSGIRCLRLRNAPAVRLGSANQRASVDFADFALPDHDHPAPVRRIGAAAAVQDHPVGMVWCKGMAVDTAALERSVAQNNRLIVGLQIPLMDRQVDANYIDWPHEPIEEVTVDVRIGNCVDDRLEPSPLPVRPSYTNVEVQLAAPIGAQQLLPLG